MLQLIYSLKKEHTKVMKHKQIELESLPPFKYITYDI